ncbi:PAS domain S-box protein [Candidatus Kaiserbacteria bacterium]|nr:PAS domain S-box protein [Candidatus Kaiserbacteria bacterium]
MPSVQRIKIFRYVERVFLVLFVLWTVAVEAMWFMNKIVLNELVASIGVSVVLFILFVYVQRTVDAWLTMRWASNELVEEDVFDSLYERSPVAYVTLDQSGKILTANPAAVNLMQGSFDTIGNVDLFDLISAEDETDVVVLRRTAESGATTNNKEFILTTMTGSKIWISISVYKYRNTGERLVAMTDITEKKNIDTAKSEFVALATHQLRTPIAAIRWNVELLGRTVKETRTEAQARYLDKVNRNVLKMIDLINDFLSVSKLEMGTYASDITNINLTEFFSSVLDEYEEKISEKQIQIIREDNPPQVVVPADKRLLHIVISNLVSNAVKYTAADGQIKLSYQLEGEWVKILVADSGIGVPEQELPYLFTKFYRATNAQQKQTEGTGLGLYIVKQSVEQLGGTIQVASKEDEGTSFSITLPARG